MTASTLLLAALLSAAPTSGATTPPAPFTQPMDSTKRFLNLDGSEPAGLSDVLRWSIWDRLTGARRVSPPRALVPEVRADPALLARPPAPGEPARLTWLGHAT